MKHIISVSLVGLVSCTQLQKPVAPKGQLGLDVRMPAAPNATMNASGGSYLPLHFSVRLKSEVSAFEWNMRIDPPQEFEIDVPVEALEVRGLLIAVPLAAGETKETYCAQRGTESEFKAGFKELFVSQYSSRFVPEATSEFIPISFPDFQTTTATPIGIRNPTVTAAVPATSASLGIDRVVENHTGFEIQDPCTQQPVVLDSSVRTTLFLPISSKLNFSIAGQRTAAAPTGATGATATTVNRMPVVLNATAGRVTFFNFDPNQRILNTPPDTDDFDGDGQNNAAEIAAGTNPFLIGLFLPPSPTLLADKVFLNLPTNANAYRYVCRLDGVDADFKPCPFTTTNAVLVSGATTMTVRAYDRMGFKVNAIDHVVTLSTSAVTIASATGTAAMFLPTLPPSTNNASSLTFTVGGTNVEQYSYVLNHSASIAAVCPLTAASYTTWTPISNNTISLTPSHLAADGSYRLCLAGRNPAGEFQNIPPSEFAWVKDTTGAIPSDMTVTGPALTNDTATITIEKVNPSIMHFSYQTVVGGGCPAIASTPTWIAFTNVSMNEVVDLTSHPDGTVRMCVWSKLSNGNIATTPTVHVWTKLSTPPTASIANAPTGTNSIAALSVTISGSAVHEYKHKLISSGVCSDSAGYSASWSPVTNNITDAVGPDGTYTLCVIGRDAVGNEQALGSASVASWTKTSAGSLTIVKTSGPSNVSFGSSIDFTFTVTNSYGTSQSSLSITKTNNGAEWTDLGGSTCTATLAANTTCTYLLRLTYLEPGISPSNTIDLKQSGTTVSSDVINVTLDTANLSVSALNPMFDKWGEQVKITSAINYSNLNASSNQCTGIAGENRTKCFNAAFLRTAQLAGPTSCAGYSAEDTENALVWRCEPSGSTLRFYSTELNQNKRVYELIDDSGSFVWKLNSLVIKKNTVIVGQSANTNWWSSTPILNLPDNSTNSAPEVLNAATVYALKTNRNTEGGYYLGGHGITIAIKPGVNLKYGALVGTPHNCNSANGTITAPSAKCILTTDKGFHIIEGDFDGQNAYLPTYGFFAYGQSARLIQLRYFNIARADLANIKLSDTSEALVFRSRSAFAQAGGGTGEGLIFTGATIPSVGSEHRVIESLFYSNSGTGITLSTNNAQDTVISRVIATNNQESQIMSYTRLHVHLSTIANTGGNGIQLVTGSPTNSSVTQTFFMNTPISVSAGIVVPTYMNFIFGQLAAASTPTFLSLTGGGSPGTPIGFGNIVMPSGGTTCVSSNFGSFTAACELPSFINRVLNSLVVNAPVGKVTTDDSANTSDSSGQGASPSTVEPFRFISPFRTWGKNPSGGWPSVDSQGACVGACRIFDWAIKAGDINLLNRSDDFTNVNGGWTDNTTCPAAVHGDKTIVYLSKKYLSNAAEILFDGIGNDDGLCESNEACLYQPNVGAYMGHGPFEGTPNCVFQDGVSADAVTNIKMFRYPQNGM